jgi:hypothetical protein
MSTRKLRKSVKKPATHQIGDTVYLLPGAADVHDAVKGVLVAHTDDRQLVLQTEGRQALLVHYSEVLSPEAAKELDADLDKLVLAVAKLGDAKQEVRSISSRIHRCYTPENLVMTIEDVEDEPEEHEPEVYCLNCDEDCEPGCGCPNLECACLK